MTTAVITRSREAAIRDLLEQILAEPGPTNHQDNLRATTYDRAATDRQLARAEILQQLYGIDEVAAVYHRWIEGNAAEQAQTTAPIAAWNELAMDTKPLQWLGDRHGFLCYCCGDRYWQVYIKSERDLFCKGCARTLAGDNPRDTWDEPTFSISEVIPIRLPVAHGTFAFPGLPLGAEPENQLSITDDAGTVHTYGLGDANAVLLPEGWMGMETERWVEGTFERPTMIVTGYTPRPGHWFTFMAAFEYDASPQSWHGRPYGFRFTFGTLTASGGRTADFDEPFTMLDTIAAGEDALAPVR